MSPQPLKSCKRQRERERQCVREIRVPCRDDVPMATSIHVPIKPYLAKPHVAHNGSNNDALDDGPFIELAGILPVLTFLRLGCKLPPAAAAVVVDVDDQFSPGQSTDRQHGGGLHCVFVALPSLQSA